MQRMWLIGRLFLKNRQPNKFRDKQDVEHSGEIKNTGNVSLVTRAELSEMSQEKKDDIGFVES